MAAILVGEDPASHLYVRLKEKACNEVGIYFEKIVFPAETSETELIKKVHELNARKDIHGILVQVPLPEHNEGIVLREIAPEKDIDGFHEKNLQALEAGKPGLVPPVALGIMKLVTQSNVDLRNKLATLVCSEIFGRPLVALLKELGVEATIIHPDSPDLDEVVREADVVIVAIGRAKFIKGDQLKKGVIVIDVGTNRTDHGLLGDVDKLSAESVAGWLTPVPGGVGPTTVAMLMVNIVKAYLVQKKK